jgi:hypothetical protein
MVLLKEIKERLNAKEFGLFLTWDKPLTYYEIMDILDLGYVTVSRKLNLWIVRNWIKKMPIQAKQKQRFFPIIDKEKED